MLTIEDEFRLFFQARFGMHDSVASPQVLEIIRDSFYAGLIVVNKWCNDGSESEIEHFVESIETFHAEIEARLKEGMH